MSSIYGSPYGGGGGLSQSEVDARVVAVAPMIYQPAMMQYDGSTGYYSLIDSFTTSGNLLTAVVLFNRASFTGDAVEGLFRLDGDNDQQRLHVSVISSDYTADTDWQDRIAITVKNSSNVVICRLFSETDYLDGENHVLHFAFNGDNSTAVFNIDGADADDSDHPDRTAPTTGTVEGGTSSTLVIGSNTSAGTSHFAGKIGAVGYADAYLTDPGDFSNGALILPIDENSWTEWGGQPRFWNPHGQMTKNLGSAGNMTKNGSIDLWLPGFGNSTGLVID